MLREPALTNGAALPRWLNAILIGVIALAVAAALVWPLLRFNAAVAPSGPASVGVISKELPRVDAAGRIGAPAPDFAWIDPDGSSRSLGTLGGLVVVLNFWATWCVPCREEMPALERVAQARPDVVFLEVDLQEDAAAVRAFFDRLDLKTLRPLVDTDGAITRRYGVMSLPTTYFVDRDGIIRHVEIGGPMSDEKIVSGIRAASTR